MRGIILAGGSATRLRPASLAVSKQLMPVYDKPLIYYPLTTLMLSGIREILLISTPKEIDRYKDLFYQSNRWGINIEFKVQPNPGGLAEAFVIGESFVRGHKSTLILGDNLFHGTGLGREQMSSFDGSGAQIAAYQVANPTAFGVVEFDNNGIATSLEEKPSNPKSKWAVPGLYQYDETVCERTKSLKLSPRGELEITDLNITYMKEKKLKVRVFPRGTTWLDMGTPNTLLEASEYIRVIQERQGTLVGSPEEAAWSLGWIDDEQLLELALETNGTEYSKSLSELVTKGA